MNILTHVVEYLEASYIDLDAQMLPFGGQGSNQAIEDGGSLGYIFTGVDNSSEIEKRLSLFERVRRNRASRVQILSRARAGREKEVEQELRRYADPPGSRTSLI